MVDELMKSLACFFAAAIFQAVGSWAPFFLAQSSGMLEVIQLGGTGGLIVALLGAVFMLWKERKQVGEEWKSEVAALRDLLKKEREDHREDTLAASLRHKKEIEELSDRYTDELRTQIAALREETDARMKQYEKG